MSKTALIVDDSRLAQMVLKKMLLAENLKVDCSNSAEDAFDYLQQRQPDMIFLDHTMPGMDGLEALKKLKEDDSTRDIPVFMYTSQEDEAYMDQALATGASEVLPKQLSTDRLREVLLKTGEHAPDHSPGKAEHSETLEQIVYDAEEALKHETWQQRFRLAFEQHRDDTEAELELINHRLQQLRLQQSDSPFRRQLLWNRMLGIALFAVAIGVFFSVYLQQNRQIGELQQLLLSQAQIPEKIAPEQQATVTGNTVVTGEPATGNPTADPALNPEPGPAYYEELAAVYNSEARIPFGDALLGNKALVLFEELDQVLRADNFAGVVVISAADSRFCIEADGQGQTRLAAAQTLLSACRFNIPAEETAANISVEMQQFIDARNRSGTRYNYLIGSVQQADIRGLLEITEKTTAAEWNTVAAMNRRLLFSFEPAAP